MSIDEKIELIKRNTEEIIGEEELIEKLKNKKQLVIYWGTAPTGKPHVGYLFPLLKISDFLKVGCKVKILFADLHAALDNTPWDLLEKRYDYYSKVLKGVINLLGADTKNLEFIRGKDFQLSRDYIYDLFKISSTTSVHDCHKAASEVVKMGENPKLSGYIYPIMQALDEEYLNVDAQLGGTDQRKIMVLAREKLPEMNYKKRVEIINPFIPGLIGKKMSASIENSKIDFLDDEKIIKKKIQNAEFEEGNPDNAIMAILRYIIFTKKKEDKKELIIERPDKYGGNLKYQDYETLEGDVIKKKIHPLDLKNTTAKEITNLLKPLDKMKKELKELSTKAYP